MTDRELLELAAAGTWNETPFGTRSPTTARRGAAAGGEARD